MCRYRQRPGRCRPVHFDGQVGSRCVLARVFGLLESLVSLSVGLGALIASLLINLTSLRVALVAVGALCPIVVVAAWRRRLGRLDRYIELDKDSSASRRADASTAAAARYRTSCPWLRTRPRACRAGHISQDDPADRFYVIETGAAEVVGDGRLLTTLGRGDGFGEIALLHKVRCTAMVRAATDLELHALTCDRFLPVVTGFPPSAREAGTESRRCSTDSAQTNRLTIKIGLDTNADPRTSESAVAAASHLA